MARAVLVNGRSGALKQTGAARRWSPETPFIIHPRSLRNSAGFRALNLPARRVLDFLELEHLSHGGGENGNLVAPYLQLTRCGISRRDIHPAIEMLDAFGFVKRTYAGDRLGGKAGCATYRLTWLPTPDGSLPTNDFKTVSETNVNAFLMERSLDLAIARQRKLRNVGSSDNHGNI